MIRTIDPATYASLAPKVAANQAFMAKYSHCRGNEPEPTPHPTIGNTEAGQVEQFEILRDLPETIVAYMSLSREARESTNYAPCRRWDVTTWTGLPIGFAYETSKWRTPRSFVSLTMSQFTATIGGRQYTGRGAGDGMSIVLRETAASKRKREA